MKNAYEEIKITGDTFRKSREESWKLLEKLLENIEQRGFKQLSEDDILKLPLLYTAAISSLSVARSISLDVDMISYLESLCSKAYLYLYTEKDPFKTIIINFISTEFPRTVRKAWKQLLFSIALLLLGVYVGLFVYSYDPPVFGSYLSSEFNSMVNIISDIDSHAGITVFPFVQLSVIAFFFMIFGFGYGILTALYLFMQGLTLGLLIHESGTGIFWSAGPILFSLIILASSSFFIADVILFQEKTKQVIFPDQISYAGLPLTVLGILSFPVNYLIFLLLPFAKPVNLILMLILWAGYLCNGLRKTNSNFQTTDLIWSKK